MHMNPHVIFTRTYQLCALFCFMFHSEKRIIRLLQSFGELSAECFIQLLKLSEKFLTECTIIVPTHLVFDIRLIEMFSISAFLPLLFMPGQFTRIKLHKQVLILISLFLLFVLLQGLCNLHLKQINKLEFDLQST